MNTDIETQIRNSVLLNPDILYTIVNWLSLEDRIHFFRTLKGMPEFRSLSDHEQSEFIQNIVKSLLPGYKSTVLSDTVRFDTENEEELIYIQGSFSYKFSVMYKESDGIPVVNMKKLNKICYFVSEDSTYSDQYYIKGIISHGYVWNLDGKAGEISISDKRLDIYCDDTETGMTRIYIGGKMKHEGWYIGEIIARKNNYPATTTILNPYETPVYLGHNISERWWYTDSVRIQEWIPDGHIHKYVVEDYRE